jgi:hypothetical protein
MLYYTPNPDFFKKNFQFFFKWRVTRMPLASASLFCQAIEVVWKAENPQLEHLVVCGISMQWQ